MSYGYWCWTNWSYEFGYLQTLRGRDRVRLFRLAWDLACSSSAGRQVLYERFFGGDPATLQAARFQSFDRRAMVARVQALLDSTPGDGA